MKSMTNSLQNQGEQPAIFS